MDLRKRIEKLKPSKVLVLVFGIQAALIVFRTLNLYVTGFMTPDEANYVFDIIAGHPYGLRYFFSGQLAFLFKLFSINSFSRFEVFFPFYLVAWSFSFLILAYATVNLVTQDRRARAFVMLSLPFAISYSLLSVGILTEQVGLTMCMLGIYAWLRYAKTHGRWYLAAISSAAFVAAAYSREPYVIFPVAGALAWIALVISRKIPIRHIVIFVAIALIVSVPNNVYTPAYLGPSGAVVGVAESAQTVTTTTIVTNTVSTVTRTSATVIVLNSTTTTTATTRTLTLNTTTVVTEVARPAPFSQGFFTGWAQVVANSATLFFVGLAVGWGPVLLVISLVALLLLLRIRPRREIPWLQLFMIILSLATFYGSVFTFYQEFHFYLTQGLSNLIRLTNTAIPAYILLSPILCEKLSGRRVKILAIILVAFTAGSVGFTITAVQSNLLLPYNALDFGHTYAPLAARNYLLQNASADNPAVVFITPGWGTAEFFLLGIPGIEVQPHTNVFDASGASDAAKFLNSSYANMLFIRLHPSTFYVLCTKGLHNWNSSLPLTANVQYLQDSSAIFFIKTYGLLYHIDTSNYQPTPYTIDGVQVVFDSHTGHLLKVHVAWAGY